MTRSDNTRQALIVDDDPILRNLMDTLLRRKGIVSAQAANGEEAVVLLQSSIGPDGESSYDLLVLDLMMPRMNGWELITFIEQKMPQVRKNMIVMSAAGEGVLSEVRARGCSAVAKPFEVIEFYQLVDRCLRGPHDLGTPGDPRLPIGTM